MSWLLRCFRQENQFACPKADCTAGELETAPRAGRRSCLASTVKHHGLAGTAARDKGPKTEKRMKNWMANIGRDAADHRENAIRLPSGITPAWTGRERGREGEGEREKERDGGVDSHERERHGWLARRPSWDALGKGV